MTRVRVSGTPGGPPHALKRVVVTDHAFASLEVESTAARSNGAVFEVRDCRTEDETVEAVRGATVALVNLAPITRKVLMGMAPGAVVVRYGVGYDNVDLDAARDLGIAVANAVGYGTASVADHAAALLLSVLRRLPQFDNAVHMAQWPMATAFGRILSFETMTVGLVGTGRIGLALADRLRGFGFDLLAFDPLIDPQVAAEHGVHLVEFDELVCRSAAVSLHAPLTSATRHILDARALALLPRGAVVINTARGGLLDTAALIDAVRLGHIAGAALDVHEDEPIPAGSALLGDRRFLLTPHVAFYNETSVVQLQRLAADEVERALTGMPPINCVN